MSRIRRLVLVNLVTVLVVLVAIVYKNDIARAVLGIPFLLFLPGNALLSAFAPNRKGGLIETVGLSSALSLAIVPLLGLILNYTVGITLNPIVVSVGVFTFECSLIEFIAHRRLQSSYDDYSADDVSPSQASKAGDGVLFGIMIVAVVCVLVSVAWFAVWPKGGETFTNLYFVGEDGKPASGLSLVVADQAIVNVAIENHERKAMVYTARLDVDGTAAGVIGPFQLKEGDQFTGHFEPIRLTAQQEKVQVTLFVDGRSLPYLKPIYFWATNTGAGP